MTLSWIRKNVVHRYIYFLKIWKTGLSKKKNSHKSNFVVTVALIFWRTPGSMFWSFFASHESCWLSQILVWLVFLSPPLNISWITILMLVTKLRHIVHQISRTWTLDSFSRSTLAEFSNCPNALWIRYLNPFSGGWYVYRLVKVSVLVAEIWDSVKTGGGCKKDKHFSAQQSFSVGRVHH